MYHMANICHALGTHTGPTLIHNRSAPPPPALSPAPSTSGNPHTLRVCLIFFLFAVNLSSAPSKQAHLPAGCTFCQTHVEQSTNSARVWVYVSAGATENKHSGWKHVCQNWSAQKLISSTEATKVLAVKVRIKGSERKLACNSEEYDFLRTNYTPRCNHLYPSFSNPRPWKNLSSKYVSARMKWFCVISYKLKVKLIN